MQDYESGHEGESRVTEQLAHDIHAVLERFSDLKTDQVKVYFLSDGSQSIQKLIDDLAQVNICCQQALPQENMLRLDPSLDAKAIYPMLATLATAAMAMDSTSRHIDLTETLYQPPTRSAKKMSLPTLPLMVATILVLLITCLLVAYRADVKALDRLEKQMQAVESEIPLQDFLQANHIRQLTAAQRVNLLELLEVIQANRPEAVVLDSLEFKRYQPVTLKGHVKENKEIHFQFLEKLQAAKGLSDARLVDPVYDQKKKEMNFTIHFHYKNFTKKKK